MSRLVSLAVLLTIIVVIGILFYKVMIGFFVPVFLAAVLVVVFRPLHRWVINKCEKREYLAAGITTFLILLSVLLPTGFILTTAAIQGISLVSNSSQNSANISLVLNKARSVLRLEMPYEDSLQKITSQIDLIQKDIADPEGDMDKLKEPNSQLSKQTKALKDALDALGKEITDTSVKIQDDLRDLDALINSTPSSQTSRIKDLTTRKRKLKRKLDIELRRKGGFDRKGNALFGWDDLSPKVYESLEKVTPEKWAEVKSESIEPPANDSPTEEIPPPTTSPTDIIELGTRAVVLGASWKNLREGLLGGTTMAFLIERSNPDAKEITDITNSILDYIRPRLLSFTGVTGLFLVKLIIGVAILMVSLFFFLYDGPGMVRAVMQLSPLDDRYERELLMEFDRTSRAIVLAMILSALAQGMLAGVGYYFAGVNSLLLLTALTIVCALIPFVGPSLVWIPVCLYLGVVEERVLAAVLLAIWGLAAVATIDNVVKTLVLHGQSQLHPLLALLSVLGGVQALGPIGIVVGPMAVTLLQTLLGILQSELINLDGDESSEKPVAGLVRKLKQRNAKNSLTPTPTEVVIPEVKPE